MKSILKQIDKQNEKKQLLLKQIATKKNKIKEYV